MCHDAYVEAREQLAGGSSLRPTLGILEIKLRLPGLIASILTRAATSPALLVFSLLFFRILNYVYMSVFNPNTT